MIIYSLGFAYWENDILLIRKNKPDWQKGKLNGIGGKVEDGEAPLEAMIREFQEEVGLDTKADYWKSEFQMGDGSNWSADVFSLNSQKIRNFKHMEAEEPVIVPLDTISTRTDVIPNLKWIIPMILDPEWDRSYQHFINY